MRGIFLTLLCALALILVGPPTATYAQTDNGPVVTTNTNDDYLPGPYPHTAFGARAGFGLTPDQFVFGVQSILGPISSHSDNFLSRLQFAPSIDIGFGSSTTSFMLNPDLRATLFAMPNSDLHFYGKVGPTLSILSSHGSSSTDLGLNLAAGIAMPMAGRNMYNLEARFGVGDVPDFRLLFGVQFGINPGGGTSTGAVSR